MDPNTLQALLAGMTHGGAPGAPEAGENEPPEDDQPGSELDDSPTEILKEMIAAAQDYMAVEPDHDDKLTMTKALALIQAILAKEQKEEQSQASTTVAQSPSNQPTYSPTPRQ